MTERVRTDPRISRRRRAIERARRRKLAVGAAGIAFAGLAVYGAFWSPLLSVRDVQVLGVRNVAAGDIESAAALHGENLLLLSTADAAARIETLPWVKEAQVDRVLPATVRVRVRERKPAVVLAVGEQRWLLDQTGHVLEPGEREGLVMVAGVPLPAVTPGETVASPEARAALAVWRSLPQGLRAKVAGIFAPTVERITLSLRDSTQIRYGAAEALGAKASVLRAVLATLASEARRVAYIDVRVPGSPAVGPAVTSVSPSPAPTIAPSPSPSV